jgi:hypothetical protein
MVGRLEQIGYQFVRLSCVLSYNRRPPGPGRQEFGPATVAASPAGAATGPRLPRPPTGPGSRFRVLMPGERDTSTGREVPCGRIGWEASCTRLRPRRGWHGRRRAPVLQPQAPPDTSSRPDQEPAVGGRLRYPEAGRQLAPRASADQDVDDGREERLIGRVLRSAALRPHSRRWDQRLRDLPQSVRNNPTPRTPPHVRPRRAAVRQASM